MMSPHDTSPVLKLLGAIGFAGLLGLAALFGVMVFCIGKSCS